MNVFVYKCTKCKPTFAISPCFKVLVAKGGEPASPGCCDVDGRLVDWERTDISELVDWLRGRE
jgi:hypothetical protein